MSLMGGRGRRGPLAGAATGPHRVAVVWIGGRL